MKHAGSTPHSPDNDGNNNFPGHEAVLVLGEPGSQHLEAHMRSAAPVKSQALDGTLDSCLVTREGLFPYCSTCHSCKLRGALLRSSNETTHYHPQHAFNECKKY